MLDTSSGASALSLALSRMNAGATSTSPFWTASLRSVSLVKYWAVTSLVFALSRTPSYLSFASYAIRSFSL